jgi:predicted Zn-dependent peptidase
MREVLSKQISGQGSAQIGMDARVLQGPLWVTLQSPKSEIDKQINSVLDSMSQFKSAQPAAEAVERAKSDIISEFAKKMSTPEGAAGVILDIELYGLGRDYLVTFADRVNAVTLADIQKAAQTYLKPQTAAVIVAGPAKELDATLKNLGTVTVMP